MKFDILNRYSGAVQFTAEIEATYGAAWSFKLGLAIKAALSSGANLSDADLSRADLSDADLSRANLSRANLSRANLSGANLSRANLSRADLYGADLSRADLSDADLSRADLYGADLSRADLSDADLSDADLSRADLSRADLSGANLSRADLSDADLYGANLPNTPEALLAVQRTRILPEGALIGWKKCQHGVIVKLRIPEDAARSHAFGRKCRAEFVDVLEVFGAQEGRSQHDDGRTIYRTGERVMPDCFDPDWKEECSSGIHFFITREEAEAY